MRRYHFDAGNSTDGTLGFCAAVYARSKNEALAKLRRRLPSELAVASWVNGGDNDGIEYVQIYFNDAALTLRDIDDVEDGHDISSNMQPEF